jgi:hypothetical protein
MTNETAQRARDDTVDPVVLKLEEFLPYRLNVCASLVSHALSESTPSATDQGCQMAR